MTATRTPWWQHPVAPGRRLVAACLFAVVAVCGGATSAAASPVAVDGIRAGWGWPLQPTPRVVRSFDPPVQPWLPGHRGVDLAGTPGQAVHAPTRGTVRFAGSVAGRGVAVVQTGDLRLTFEPVEPVVKVGQQVQAGSVLGHLRLTQSHCLPAACLHWGVKRGDNYLDPLSFVREAAIILLPLAGPLSAYAGETRTTSAAGGRGVTALTTPAATSAQAAVAMAFALDQIGDPYVWAAAGPHSWDCSGLVMAAWRAAGKSLPHYSVAQYDATTPVTATQLRPGDLVFWSATDSPSGIYHVAMYLGGGRMVHAPRTGETVQVEGMYSWDSPDFFGRV